MACIDLQLPEDIWQCVASFIPIAELPILISVNKAFYNIVLDARYREIYWVKLDGFMSKSLVRLRTPSIARRVRRLHIRAWFIEYLVRKESLEPTSYFLSSKRWVSRQLRLPLTPVRITPGLSGKSSAAREILESMTAAARLMTGLTEYSFEWRDLSPTPDTLQLLATARTAFGKSLRKLTLNAQLPNFSKLLSTADFDSLEELELYFDHDTDDLSGGLLRDNITPFVNHFRRSLRSLLISSSSKADLSPLFYALQPLPHLHNFVVCLAFDVIHLSDPHGFVQTLRTNADSLSSVEVGQSSAASSYPDPAPRSTWVGLTTALMLDEAILADLTVLKIPALHDFDATIACLRRSANTLESLTLLDFFLTESQLVELINLFAHRRFDVGLKTLHIGITYLSPTVFDLISSRLPGLLSLSIVLWGAILASEVGDHHTRFRSPFCLALVGHHYPDWSLTNLGIWEKRFIDSPITKSDEKMLMEHLSRCIPGLQTFKGKPIPSSFDWCPVWDGDRQR
ncbi:hypothetical protein B0H15DRAFT_888719 [Mycena belliarum]|uniref:F-box domain-containing protein n=1 Tax=Mycena belliarum TaxID=1033014 RepID=A0AAD6XPG2_9AGAR|nr:hypothetical protein B0H15DRAFT_888719 [Mycena belliae]